MLDSYYAEAAQKIYIRHIKGEQPKTTDFHLHDYFEIYFFISGDVNYFIEKKFYTLKYGDLMVMNDHEIHRPSVHPDSHYERIIMHFDPSIAKLLSSPGFDLLDCFINRPRGEQNKISLSKNQISDLLEMFKKIGYAHQSTSAGSEVLKLAYFTELLVYLNRVFKSAQYLDEHPNVPEKLLTVLDFIDSNLEGDLTLESLEQKFFINRFHLSRLFKKSTGINIHEYIIYKRMSMAKKLLMDGNSVTEVCHMTGFDDYSHFIRIFKRIVGVSPGQYKKSNKMLAQ